MVFTFHHNGPFPCHVWRFAIRKITHGHTQLNVWSCAEVLMAMREKKMRMAMSNIAYGHAYGKITKMLMAIRYFAHGHELFCSWPCAILLMAMR